ncbi:MAG: DUF488 domain-containing protein [Frankiaceae bacterium]|nr:DUF488 domain-containing protein [Frankiaceae bacterium]MBV9872508.1 DUF488 domain-containing protein [Frankiaceae bacterium]
MELFTIGFTRKSAAEFFGLLQTAGVKRVVDVRRNNVSQLAGFTKRHDLEYFLRSIAHIDYVHVPELSPPQTLIEAYRKGGLPYDEFAAKFRRLLAAAEVEKHPAAQLQDGDCLLCTEPEALTCHRSVVASYLAPHLGHPSVRDL